MKKRLFGTMAAPSRTVRSRQAFLLASAMLLAPIYAHAAPAISQSGAGNVNLTVSFTLPPTTGSLNQGVALVSTAAAVNLTVTGTGSIDATQAIGVLLSAPAASTLTVLSGGSIVGVTGVDASAHTDLESSPFDANRPGMTGGLSLTNAGTITGTGGTAIQFGSGDDTLTLETGSTITGGVDGGTGANTVVLSGTVATQSASQTVGGYTNFQALDVNAGFWTLGSAATYPTATIASAATLEVLDTLTGAVTVQANGALIVGDGVHQGQLAGSLIDNGSVVFNDPADYVFDGGFSGSGALVKDGPGVLTFNGLYSFTGSTTINGGSIDISQLAANTDIDLTGGQLNLTGTASSIGVLTGTGGVVNVASGDTLSVSSGDFGGNITGGGSLTKVGAATLDLTGVDSLTGVTEVAGGVLQIDGSLTSPVTVDSGATLGGAGSITGQVTVASGGVFSPGDPVTTTVIGGVTFATGSSYFAQVTPTGGHDLIAVTGPVVIQHGASVEVDPLGLATAYGRLSSYNIITATGGVTGTFSSVTSDAPLLTPHLAYPTGAVQLSLTRNDISFASLAATRNQSAAAAAIEAGGFGSPLYMALVVQNAAGARQGYDALSGELFASLPTILLSQSDQTRRTLNDRMEQPSDARGVWGEAIGGWARFDGAPGVAGASTSLGGGTIGIDDTVHGWRLGIAGSYEQDRIDVAARGSSAVDQAEGVSLYASRASGPLAVRLGASYMWHSLDSSRNEVFPGFNDHTTANFNAGTTQAFGEIGYDLALRRGSIEPFAGISYDEVTMQGATENGGPAALTVAGQTREMLSTRFGVRASADVGSDSGPAVTLHGSAAVRVVTDQWDLPGAELAGATQTSFRGTGQSFLVRGLPLAKEAAEITAGVSAKAGAHGKIDLSYSGEIASRWQDHGVKLLASWAF